jgi:hypothetical protein
MNLTIEEKLRKISRDLTKLMKCTNHQGRLVQHEGSYGHFWVHYHPCPFCEPEQKIDYRDCKE